MAKVLEVLRFAAAGCPTFSKRDAFTCLGGIIDKVSKLRMCMSTCTELLTRALRLQHQCGLDAPCLMLPNT